MDTFIKMGIESGPLTQTLAGLEKGRTGFVKNVRGHGAVSRRLMEMGIVPGVRVRVIKMAPFGGPIELRVRGYNLALRRSEAETVEVTCDAG